MTCFPFPLALINFLARTISAFTSSLSSSLSESDSARLFIGFFLFFFSFQHHLFFLFLSTSFSFLQKFLMTRIAALTVFFEVFRFGIRLMASRTLFVHPVLAVQTIRFVRHQKFIKFTPTARFSRRFYLKRRHYPSPSESELLFILTRGLFVLFFMNILVTATTTNYA